MSTDDRLTSRMELNIQLKDIHQAAIEFWRLNGDKKIFAFHGEMGAGKTTFIHALCDVKGVRDRGKQPNFFNDQRI